MISTTDVAKLFFNQNQFFQAFLCNHDEFSVFKCINFLTKAKIAKTNLRHFHERMATVNVPVTNAMMGVVEWPYIHNEWDTVQRLNTIASHYELLHGRFSGLMNIHQGNTIKIIQFGEEYSDISVVLDRPNWFTREGEIVINLVHNQLRVASIAFTLSKKSQRVVAYIGALQGIHSGIPSAESLGIYKQLTKLFHGLRPKTLLLEVLKAYLNTLGVNQLYGIADQHRHHRHKYFGFDQTTVFKSDYNGFWEEHGGYLNKCMGFYNITMQAAIREIETIPSKKRSQYRKRNAMIESLEACLSDIE